MDFVWCTECFPPRHHDRGEHEGAPIAATQANRDVKRAWESHNRRAPAKATLATPRKGARTGRKRGKDRR